jgi:hypothetical protein
MTVATFPGIQGHLRRARRRCQPLSRTSAPRSANALKSSRYLRDCLGNDPLNTTPMTFMKPWNSNTLRETSALFPAPAR